ncbi:MAG TPA: hypothetical protein VGA53_01860 [Candidatus Paceibacterota bacterium]
MSFFQEFRTETKLLLVVALTAIILVVGGIFLLRGMGSPLVAQTSPPIPSPQPQTIDAEDFTLSEVEGWQTYRDEKYGFELRLPEGFNLEGGTIDGPYQRVFSKASQQSLQTVGIAVIGNEDLGERSLSFEEFVEQQRQTMEKSEIVVSGGYNAIKMANGVYFAKEENIYYIYGNIRGGNDFMKFSQLFEQILSTFRFMR